MVYIPEFRTRDEFIHRCAEYGLEPMDVVQLAGLTGMLPKAMQVLPKGPREDLHRTIEKLHSTKQPKSPSPASANVTEPADSVQPHIDGPAEDVALTRHQASSDRGISGPPTDGSPVDPVLPRLNTITMPALADRDVQWAKRLSHTKADRITGPAFAIPADGEGFLREADDAIRSSLKRMVGAVFEIGRVLEGVKRHLGHGRYLAWVDHSCCLSRREAQRYLKVWNRFGTKSAIMAHLPLATLDHLASQKISDELRREITDALEAAPMSLGAREIEGKLKAAAAKPALEVGEAADADHALEPTRTAFRFLEAKFTKAERRQLAELLATSDTARLIRLLRAEP